jgi:outer membrane protein insertion porin family
MQVMERFLLPAARFASVVLGLLLCGRAVLAQNSAPPGKVLISDVIITGNHRMSTEQIKVRLHTQPGNEYNPAVVDEDVRQLYKLNQFSVIQTLVEQDGPGKVKVFFTLREMPNTVQNVTFLGAKHMKEKDLREATGVQKGNSLNPNLNRQGCQRILDKYMEIGRTLSDCQLLKGGDLADTEVVYQITEGPKIKVCDIRFTGNTFVRSARLARILASSSWFDRNRIGGTYHTRSTNYEIDELCDYYLSFGYQDVKIAVETQRSADGSEVTLIFHIQEGPRYRVADKPELRVPISLRHEHLQDLVKIGRGDYVTRNAVCQDVERIRDRCESLHRFVSVEAIPVSLPSQPGLVNVRYEVKEIEYRINAICVRGNKRISSESILAHIPLVPGQVISYADLKRAEQILAELGLFVVDEAAGVRPTITVEDLYGSERKDLLITVKEKAKAKSTSGKLP